MRQLTFKNLKPLPYGPEEALNRLRVNFNFCGDRFKKIVITSSMPNEGKSAISANLWRLLAETGKRVVMIDADLRKSILRSRYMITLDGGEKTSEVPGLAYYLSGQSAKEDVVYATNIRNAYVVPVFHTIANPAILFQGTRFKELLDWLAESFDYVLVDTPPLSSVADADLIANQCDGALLVVRGSFTPRALVADSLKQLERANCRLMGVVLNRVTAENNAYYRYGKYSKYGKYSNYGYSSSGSDAGKATSGKKSTEKQ